MAPTDPADDKHVIVDIRTTKRDRLDWISFSIQALTLFFVGAYTLVTCVQLRQSETSERQQLRPWLFAKDIVDITSTGVVQGRGGGVITHYPVRVSIKNYGQSVATYVVGIGHLYSDVPEVLIEHWGEACEEAKKKLATPDPKKRWPSGINVPPTGEAIYKLDIAAPDLNSSAFNSGSYRMIGCFAYADQIGDQHESSFCFRPTNRIEQQSSDGLASLRFEGCYEFERSN